jgi:hypothetical protein
MRWAKLLVCCCVQVGQGSRSTMEDADALSFRNDILVV